MFTEYLDMDDGGHIEVKGRSQETSLPGVYAAGDVADPTYRQAGVASGDGIRAGMDAGKFLAHLKDVVDEHVLAGIKHPV